MALLADVVSSQMQVVKAILDVWSDKLSLAGIALSFFCCHFGSRDQTSVLLVQGTSSTCGPSSLHFSTNAAAIWRFSAPLRAFVTVASRLS